MNDNMSPSVSVCICTYNRSQSLQRTLNSFASQIDNNLGPVEVLVVDNNCTDGTPKVVEAFREKLPIRSSRNVDKASPTLGTGRWRNSEGTSFCSRTTMYGSDLAGLLPIRMQSIVSRTSITLADGFCRIGARRSLGGLGMSLCR